MLCEKTSKVASLGRLIPPIVVATIRVLDRRGKELFRRCIVE